MNPENSKIILKDIYADFGTFHLKNINLEIKDKEFFVLLGPTGAGKTLILELIAGFHKYKKGELSINGRNMKKFHPSLRKIGFVYQDYSLFPHMNVEENISFGLKMQNLTSSEIKQRVSDMMTKLEIIPLKDRYSNTLSGGEQQKVALARALIIKPEILLLDEPFSAMDPVSKKNAMKIVRQIHESENLTTIKVTHNQDEALIGDRIAIIMKGEIKDVDTPKNIFNSPKNRQNAAFVGIENIFEGEIIEKKDDYVYIKTENFSVKCISEIKEGPVIIFIRPENIFLSSDNSDNHNNNRIRSEVKEIFTVSKELVQIELMNGLKAYTTIYGREALDIQVGHQIFACINSSAISVRNVESDLK